MSRGAGTAPPGFLALREGPLVALVDAELAPALRPAGLLDPARLAERLARGQGASGRAPTAEVALPGLAVTLVLRPVRRGGLLAPLLRGALLGPGRPLGELRATVALRAAGAPVPQPALALAWRRLGPIWNGAVATRREAHAVDGLAFLAAGPDARRVRNAARSVGRAVRRFHDAGGRHADLHLKNLLVREGAQGFEVIVIDLDRARHVLRVAPAARMRELMRLYRSLRKQGLEDRVGVRGCAACFRAYVAGDRVLRRAMLARLARERRRVALHAWRYRRGAPGSEPGTA